MELRTEILIIGGGATGTGLARDLSIRGIPCILVEKEDLASGASGRNQGLLHSGGRYVVSDPRTARECITENRVLRAIAPHLIEETGGLFVSLPEDGLGFQGTFIDGCREAGIETSVFTSAQALDREPNLIPDLLGAVEVPDGVIDPFGLVLANARDAEHHGARLLSQTEVTSVSLSGRRLERVFAKDRVSGEEYSIVPSYVVNATGAWANHFLRLIGIGISLALSKGSMLITNRRLTRAVINRCRPASDGDIIVPNDTVSILGTTSVGSQDAADFDVGAQEVSQIVAETSKMVPEIVRARFIRAYAGVRPLFRLATETGEESDRSVSRGFALIDHGARNEVNNLITVIGGKLVTYRLMAEKAADLLCEKMGVGVACSTHLSALPNLEEGSRPPGRMAHAHGVGHVFQGTVICDCELVRKDQIEKQLGGKKIRSFTDVLHRTRLAKGTCQGGFCAYRLMAMLDERHAVEGDSRAMLEGFLEERWRGILPILWGTAVKESELIETIYKDVLNFHTKGSNPGA